MPFLKLHFLCAGGVIHGDFYSMAIIRELSIISLVTTIYKY